MSADRAADAEDLKKKGNEYLKNKDFDKAIEYYTEAIKLNDKNHVFYSNRSAAYLSKGWSDSALKDADKCIEIKPDWPKGYGRKGAALHGLKRYDDAIKIYETALEKFPEDPSLKNALDEVKLDQAGPSMMGGGMPGMPGGDGNPFGSMFGADLFDKIKASPKIKHYMDDPTYVQTMTLLQQNPNMLTQLLGDKRVLDTVGVLTGIDFGAMQPPAGDDNTTTPPSTTTPNIPKKEPEPVKVETEEEKQKRETQEKADELKKKGNEHYKKKEFDEAKKFYEEAIEVLPIEMTYYLNIASIYLEQKDFDKTIEQCEKAIKIGNENYAAYEKKAKAFEKIGNAYLKLKKNEDEAIKYYKKANVEYLDRKREQKIRKLEKKIKLRAEKEYLDPEKAKEAKEKGNEKFKAGNFAEAVADYSEAIKRDPTNAVYYNNRSACLTKLTDFGRAMEDIEKAIKLDPKYVKAYARKGKIHQFTKNYHKALDAYRKGLELDKENYECKQGLQQVQMAINANSEDDEKARMANAATDPEIRNIMSDPIMQQILRDMQENPQAAYKHMQNKEIAAKIEKLIAAGIIKTR